MRRRWRAAGIAAVTLVACELALRWTWGAPWLPEAPGALREDPITGTAYVAAYDGVLNTPHHRTRFRTNAQGLRDRDRTYAKPRGQLRVLAIGDSFAAGHGVEMEQSFLAVTERALSGASGGVDVVKVGVGGWGPVNEWRYLAHEGHRYDPDLVLVVFYAGNDYWDAEQPFRFGVHDGVRVDRVAQGRIRWPAALRISLRRRIYLYGILADGVRGLASSKSERSAGELTIVSRCRTGASIPTGATVDAIDRFADFSRKRSVPLAFLVLPHRAQVDPARAREMARAAGQDFGDFDPDRLSMLVVGMLQARGIPHLDALPLLRAWSREHGDVGMGWDFHYNVRVHEAIGRELSSFLLPLLDERGRRS